jgi:membrane fusion protein, copper/silver efflux system
MSRSYRIGLLVCAAVLMAIVGLVLMRHRGTPVAGLNEPRDAPAAQGSSPATDKRKPQYWYDPMHASEHFDKPGKSPFMDMQLVPKYADPVPTDGGGKPPAADAPPGSIAVDSRVVQNLGIRLAKVEQGSFTRVVDTVGLVGVDEHRIEAIQVRASGWVERLDVRAVGDAVRRGQLLVGVYSPDLLATQQELMIARNSQDAALIQATRRRLALFGLSEAQIARIEESGMVERRVDYYAPFDGYVMDLGVRQGDAVQPGTTLFKLADLTSVWITAEVPETQAAWLKPGDLADIEVPARPGERFAGKVDYLYPELAQATRTLKVRVVVRNPSKHLQPGMFAAAHFHGAAQQQVLTVPSEAVIKTGTRSVIIVADDVTHFRPVLVRVGAEQGGRSEILEGLNLGQSVVASGEFLIDSEANLRGAFENLAGSNESATQSAQPSLMPVPAAQPQEKVH